MSIFLKLIAWTAGTEVAADIVVTQVLALGLGTLLYGIVLGSTFIEVWKGFRKKGLNMCYGFGLREVTHQRPRNKAHLVT
jgi:hypothetical protein